MRERPGQEEAVGAVRPGEGGRQGRRLLVIPGGERGRGQGRGNVPRPRRVRRAQGYGGNPGSCAADDQSARYVLRRRFEKCYSPRTRT
ncbi:hypothetical protein EF912_15080 [Streptomyces sp. WAC07061]|nr:hypothetical protein EF912_15080 [Streptomyces sp. WAC07061]